MQSLTGVHFLLSYRCPSECDHCFVWASPRPRARMEPEQVDRFLEEVASLDGVGEVCAEGGEAFTRYDVLLGFVRRAVALGLAPSALTNAYWVTSRRLAEERIRELVGAGLTHLGVSTDEWHQRHIPVERVDLLLEVCEEIGLPTARMVTELESVLFRGRAAERLAARMPTHPPEEFTSCPHEQLAAPGRVHLDCYGRVHLCQGLTLAGSRPARAIESYDPGRHPIVSRLLEGGPYALARWAEGWGFAMEPGYVDACHLCYRAREFLRGQFPDLLGPDEMYGP